MWTLPQLRFKPGVDPDAVTFPLDYAEAAIASLAVFERLQRGRRLLRTARRPEAAGDSQSLSGLIHYQDQAGDRARFDAARHHARVDGVSCECGWGRTNPERIGDYLRSHMALADEA